MKIHQKLCVVLCWVGCLSFHATTDAQAGMGFRFVQAHLPITGGVQPVDSLFRGFDLGFHYRWFDAGIPYNSNLRQRASESANTQDIFNCHQVNINLQYRFNRHWGFYAMVPFVYQQKSSVWEHSLVNNHMVAFQRRVTEGIGLADLIIGTRYHIFPSEKHQDLSLILGAGVKFPTGQSNATDIWHNAGPQRTDVLRPVDPAIQPGDGTWGFVVDGQVAFKVLRFLGLYAEGFYLSTPTDLNGNQTFRPLMGTLYSEEGDMSAVDQYMGRVGVSFQTKGSPLVISSGIRIDGIPVNDIIGASQGFRRSGYAVSWDNTLMVTGDKFNFYVSMPYIYFQQHLRSNSELRYAAVHNENRNAEVSFARFMLQAGFQASF